jgi:hypothetical protein
MTDLAENDQENLPVRDGDANLKRSEGGRLGV